MHGSVCVCVPLHAISKVGMGWGGSGIAGQAVCYSPAPSALLEPFHRELEGIKGGDKADLSMCPCRAAQGLIPARKAFCLAGALLLPWRGSSQSHPLPLHSAPAVTVLTLVETPPQWGHTLCRSFVWKRTWPGGCAYA